MHFLIEGAHIADRLWSYHHDQVQIKVKTLDIVI